MNFLLTLRFIDDILFSRTGGETMTQGERIKAIRKELDLSLEKFGEKLGVGKSAISNIENGNRNLTEQMCKGICREFRVNEEFLKTGEGDMFLELPEEDEVAAYVSELLEDDGNNPLYVIIKEIMHTYSELTPKSQEVLRDFSKKLISNIKEKEG